jgi:hypothetical protein
VTERRLDRITERRLGALLSRGTVAAGLVIGVGGLLAGLAPGSTATATIITGAAMFAALPVAGLVLVAWDLRRAGKVRQMATAALVVAIVAIDVVVGGLR